MNIETVSTTYARALLELAAEKDELEFVREESVFLQTLLGREKDLRTFLESPRIAKSEKTKVFEKTLRGRISDHLLNFLLLVIHLKAYSALVGIFQDDFATIFKCFIWVPS